MIDELIIKSIMDIPWLQNIEKQSALLLPLEYEFIKKEEAIASLKNYLWDNIENDEFNTLFEWFRTTSICLDWERSVSSIRKDYIPIFDSNIEKITKEIFKDNSKLVMDTINYDILMIIMRLEIKKKSIREDGPTFYDNILKIYQSGHFPCGWSGEYPNGKILVY